MSKVGKNRNKEHLQGSHIIYKLQEYIFVAFGIHSNSLGWVDQNKI